MLSIVIPIYNEEKLIAELVKRTHAALTTFTSNFEIIVVDDGSEDDSLKHLHASPVQSPEKSSPYLEILATKRPTQPD
ncbi:MAG: glycosyltransferase [Bacteroidia bacterium]|nr:glycosyltransferase [Bacteroidia bacterium]